MGPLYYCDDDDDMPLDVISQRPILRNINFPTQTHIYVKSNITPGSSLTKPLSPKYISIYAHTMRTDLVIFVLIRNMEVRRES